MQLDVHSPDVHAGVATLVPEHARPQPPQLAVELRSTRQPLAGLPLHTACVESHVGTQPPVEPLNEHAVDVVLVVAHAAAHAPQLDVVVSDVSQPLFGFESQLPCVESHVGAQPPVEPLKLHATTLVPADEQVVPHAPQLLRVVIEVSQPLFGFESQSPCVELHTGTQPPVEPLNVHDVEPLALVHAIEHAPQFDVVVSDTRQPEAGLPPHTPCVESHVGEQPPVEPLNVHDVAVVLVLAHAVAHAPQLVVV
jgi:hypothetical protein